jgi:hypothetical protein
VETRKSVSLRAGNIVGSPFFSRAVTLLNSVDDFVKGCHMQTARDTYGRSAIRGLIANILIE